MADSEKMKQIRAETGERDGKDGERGAKDDWEAIKMILDGLPNLKQRVLKRIHEIKGRTRQEGVNISRKEQQQYRRDEVRRKGTK